MAAGRKADSSRKPEDVSAAQAAQSQTAGDASGLFGDEREIERLLHGATFPKALRLRKSEEFRRVFACAERFANRHWTILIRPNGLPVPRLGLVVSRKKVGKAHRRNRIKRLAREGFRHHKRRLVGYDMVVLPREGVAETDGATLLRSFEHLVGKIARHAARAARGSA